MANIYVVDSNSNLQDGDCYTYKGVTYTVQQIDNCGPYGTIRENVTVDQCDNVLIADDMSGNVTFDTSCYSGQGTEVHIELEPTDSGVSPDYNIQFVDDGQYGGGSVTPTITVPTCEDFSHVNIDGTNTDDMTVNVEANASIGNIQGGVEGYCNGTGDGADNDVINIGDGATVGALDLGDGADSVIAGDNVTFNGTITTSGYGAVDDADTVIIGENGNIGNIITGNGSDHVSIGSGSQFDGLYTGNGSDNVTLGDNVTSTTMVRLGEGQDNLTTGTGFTAYDVQLDTELSSLQGCADDTATFGNGATITNVFYTGPGSDTVSFGSGNDICDMRMGTENHYDQGDTVEFRVPENDAGDLYNALTHDGWADNNGDRTYINNNWCDKTFDFAGVHIDNVETIIGPICFCDGSMIDTIDGPKAVETLSPGDLVKTKDHGYQPVRWMGFRSISVDDLNANPKLKPITVRAGSMGASMPEQDLTVSPQHRLMLCSKVAQRMFGSEEVLVAAKDLLAFDGIERVEAEKSVRYFHILFDQHEIVEANGMWAESLHTGPAAREEIFTIFPELASPEGIETRTPARVIASGRRRKTLLQRLQKNGKPLVEAAMLARAAATDRASA